jgi:hypothetical protein
MSRGGRCAVSAFAEFRDPAWSFSMLVVSSLGSREKRRVTNRGKIAAASKQAVQLDEKPAARTMIPDAMIRSSPGPAVKEFFDPYTAKICLIPANTCPELQAGVT